MSQTIYGLYVLIAIMANLIRIYIRQTCPRPRRYRDLFDYPVDVLREMLMASLASRITPEAAEQALNSDWPIEVGDYFVGNPGAPVAISTLATPELAPHLLRELGADVASIVGKTETCNRGVEKVVKNVVANPNIRFLLVYGYDSLDLLPGQTFVCLARSGIDGDHRVMGSPGKNCTLVNLSLEEVEHFRKQVETIDLVGCQDPERIVRAAREAALRSPGRYDKSLKMEAAPHLTAHAPGGAKLDKAGFFVIYVDRGHQRMVMEHYENQGRMTAVIEGSDASSLYCTVIEMGLVSQLDHAAYLGRELNKAETCLKQGGQYMQDGAPQAPEEV